MTSADIPPRALSSGAAMAAVSRVATTAAGAAATIVLARVLGPSGWAGYFVAQSLLVVLTAASTLGIEHGIAYFVSPGTWPPRSAYLSALRIALAGGAAGAAIGIGLRLLAPSAFAGLPLWLTTVVAAALPFALVSFYMSYLALALDRYGAYTLLPALQAALVLALSASGAVIFGLRGAVVGLATATVAVAAASVAWAERRIPRARGTGEVHIRQVISFGVKGYAANALQLLNYRLDLFILSAVASASTVGRYSLAVSLTSLLWLLPRALSDVLFPRVARLSAHGEANTLELVEAKSLRHVSLIALVSAVSLALALEVLVVPVFGANFRGSIGLGLILLPGAMAIAISSVLSATIVGRGRPAYSLYTTLVTTPLTITLYTTLIPLSGATGAAIASTISYLCGLLLTCWFYRRATGRRVLPLLVPTRSEFVDLLALPRGLVTWADARRR
jgi:O-antigen/teichoic acid export membrane protein